MLQKTKSLLTKCLAFLFIVCCVVAATVGLVACNNQVTIASIKVANGKLSVEYSDGKTEDFNLVVSKPDCKHTNTTEIVSANGTCEENILTVCNDCGHVSAKKESTHVYSVEPRHLDRKNCLVGARTAKVCIKCGDEIEVVYDEGDAGVCYTEHQNVIEATYLLDKNNIHNPNICEADTVKAKICVECNTTIEVISTTAGPGHKYGAWAWSVEPTNTTKGEVKRNCTVCGKAQTKVVPELYVLDKDGNKTETVNSAYTYELGKEALCSETGRKDSFNYTVDGEVLKIEKVERKDHYIVKDDKIVTFDAGKVYDVADYDGKLKPLGGTLTCANAGQNGVFECEGCEGTYSVKVKKAHAAYNQDKDTKVEELSKDAKCTEDGKLVYKCSVCGDNAEKVLPKLGHNITCDNVLEPEGENTKWRFVVRCTRCSDPIAPVETETAPTIKEIAATCEEPAYTVYTDIKDADGNVIMDSVDNTKALEIKVKTGDALGHNHKTLGKVDSNKAYDLNSETYKGMFSPVDVKKDFTCGDHDETDPVTGVYTCDRCDAVISVKVYRSHTGEVEVTKKPTCTEKGVQVIKDCSVCGAKNVTKDIPATGHNYNYTYTTNELTGKVATLTAVCVNDGCTEETEGHTKTLVAGVDFKDCVIIASNNCKKTGTATVTGMDDKTYDIVLAVSTEHTLNGKVMVSDWQHPYSDKVAGIRPYNGAKFSCKELTAESSANGIFECDVCGGLYTVFVKVDHVKTNVQRTVEPTCETKGEEKYHCTGCDKDYTDPIPALGHDVVVKLSEVEYEKVGDINVIKNNITLKITCKREGCAHNTATEGGSAVVITLPAVPAITVVEGKVVIADSDYYTVTEIAAVSCASKGLYKYELKDAALKVLLKEAVGEGKVAAYGDTIKVVFEGYVEEPHTFEGEEITWIVDGYKYTGHYCSVCGNVVVRSREALIK